MGIPNFEGKSVIRSSLRVTKAGDGLSEALALAPVALHHGDEVLLVLRGTVSQVNHRPASTDDPEYLVRVHTVEATEASMVEGAEAEAVEELLANGRRRVEQAKAEQLDAENRENGIFPLGDAEAEMLAAHDAGEHTELVGGCTECQAEIDAVESEKSKGKRAK